MTRDPRNLRQLYETELRPLVKALEIQRVQLRQRIVVSSISVVAIAVVIVLTTLGMGNSILAFYVAIACFVIGAIVIGAINGGPLKDYRFKFKHMIIGRLVQRYDPGLRYEPTDGITRDEFEASQIYRRRIDRYKSEDLITGRIGATTFRLSEIHAEYKVKKRTSKGGTQTKWETLFRGVFFIADFNKRFNGTTVVLPDLVERTLGGFGKLLQEWGGNLGAQPGQVVRLEDPVFEKMFAVYATDQVEARYILSTSLMQRLIQFSQNAGIFTSLSFINSQVYVAIPSTKDRFEPPFLFAKGDLVNLADLQTYLNDICLAEDIINDLNLNLRIWGKD